MQSREEIKLKEEREKKHKYVNVLNRKNCWNKRRQKDPTDKQLKGRQNDL
jgi:hypothetical protein